MGSEMCIRDSYNSEEQVLSYIRGASSWSKHPKILLIADECGGYQAADLAGLSRFDYPPVIVTLRVPCAGRVTPEIIAEAFKCGFDGVLIAAGPPEVCKYVKGAEYCRRVVELFKSEMKNVGLDASRLQLKWTVAPAAKMLASSIKEVADKLRSLRPITVSPENLSEVARRVREKLSHQQTIK